MRFSSALRDVLVSERVKWAAQNAIGVIIPLLFVLVRSISFTAACEATVFYGVSSQAFSVDRSIGGRLFGGLIWLAVSFTGGLLGFAIVSISWLARGSSVPLEGLSGLEGGSDSDPTLSSAFWILLMVLHVVFSILLMYTRSVASGLDVLYASICQIFVSIVTLAGMGLMPTLGQFGFWAHLYSTFIKGNALVLLAMVVNATVVYVQSSHDQVREQMGDVFIEMGKLFSRLASGFHLAAVDNDCAGDIERWKNDIKGCVKKPSEIMRMSLGAQASNSLCALEPAWPMLCSQVGADRFKYAHAITKVQVFLGTLKEFEIMSHLVLDNAAKRNSPINDAEKFVFNVASTVSAMIASVLASMVMPLKHMPLSGPCCGNALFWRPHDRKYWNNQMKMVSDCIQEILHPLRESSFTGITKALETEPLEVGDQRGVGIAMLTSFESMIDELIAIEIAVSRALDITDADIYTLVEEHKADFKVHPSCHTSNWKKLYDFAWVNPYTSAPLKIFCDATGINLWNLQRKVSTQLIRKIWGWIHGIFCDHKDQEDQDLVLDSERRRQYQLYIKLFFAYNIACVGIILIGWYCYANTGNYVSDATAVATWFLEWKPEYFILAVAICVQDTVDASIIKAILRVSLIGIGGSLGFAAARNGSLAQNSYYVFFITVVLNGFCGLFSPISFDFRYSLFLFIYTFNGVFVCSYTGICCEPGNIHTFGGKAVSTALGAIYAFIVSSVVFPIYSSQVAFELEGSMLQSFMHSIQTCFWKGSDMLSKQQQEQSKTIDQLSEHMAYPYLGISRGDHQEWNMSMWQAIGTRLGIISRIYKEVETRAFDKHYMFFLKITLIPLPDSLQIIFQDVVRVGSFVTLAGRVVRSSFLRGNSSSISYHLKSHMFETTDACMHAALDVSTELVRILVRNRVHQEDIDALESKVAHLEDERRQLFDVYLKTLPLLNEVNEFSYSDLRYLLWYAMLMRSIREVSFLAESMVKYDHYKDKGRRWIFPAIHSKKK